MFVWCVFGVCLGFVGAGLFLWIVVCVVFAEVACCHYYVSFFVVIDRFGVLCLVCRLDLLLCVVCCLWSFDAVLVWLLLVVVSCCLLLVAVVICCLLCVVYCCCLFLVIVVVTCSCLCSSLLFAVLFVFTVCARCHP